MPPTIVAMKAIRTMLTPIVGDDRAGLGREQDRRDRGEQARERERRGDDGVGPNPEHAGHPEVLGRGPHLGAQGRSPEEEPDDREQRERDADGDDVELRDRDLPTVNEPSRPDAKVVVRGSAPQVSAAAFWSRKLSAKEVISSVAGRGARVRDGRRPAPSRARLRPPRRA